MEKAALWTKGRPKFMEKVDGNFYLAGDGFEF